MKRTRFSRRDLLATTVAGAFAGLAGGSALGRAGLLASPVIKAGGRTLVLVQLSGGNDGLSMIVPGMDDAYHRARKSIAHKAKSLLPIDGTDLGFHPSLKGLRGHFDQGRVSIVSGCGYPNPNRSHFKSYEIWHTASAEGRASGREGWVGHLMEAVYAEQADANRVVHVGTKVPYSLYSSTHPAASFVVPENYRWAKIQGEVEAMDEGTTKTGKKAALDYVRGVMSDAVTSSDSIRRAVAGYRPGVRYPNDALGRNLATVAGLIAAGIGGRVLSVELGGFDTHNNQRRRHDALMATLNGGLSAFLDDLARTQAGRETIVLVYSEFGRRVAENGSSGTDHGTAGPMLVLGHAIQGGHFGRMPSLTDLDKGDLRFTTDFRSVYGEAIDKAFGADHAKALGAHYPTLNCI